MSKTGCDHEVLIVEAVRSGAWSEELREHAASCELCAETAFVAYHLHAEAQQVDERPLPDPGLLLRRAQLEDRYRAVHRATHVISVMQGLAAAVGGGVALVLLAWLLPAVRSAASSVVSAVPASSGSVSPATVLFGSFLVIMALVLSEMWQGRIQA